MIAKLSRIRKETDLQLLVAEVRAARGQAKPSYHDEIMPWREDGRR
jgi:hypothetical protein